MNIKKQPAWKQTLPLALVSMGLARKAVETNIQHFHCHSCGRVAILAMMVQRLVGIPFSATLHSDIRCWGGAMEQKFSDARFIIVVADWLLSQIKHEYQALNTDKFLRGSMGVDTIKWHASLDSPRLQDDLFRIVTVGRLHHNKGHDVLINSIKILIDEGRKINLKIVGAGSEEKSLKFLVRQLELTDFITFTGSISEDQIIDIMRKSDAFVSATHAEALSVVFMEAMSMEPPTIGTAVGGVPEIISHKKDGLLVPPNNKIALKEAIEFLMDNSDVRHTLSLNARKKIAEQFDSRLGAATLYKKLHGTSPEI